MGGGDGAARIFFKRKKTECGACAIGVWSGRGIGNFLYVKNLNMVCGVIGVSERGWEGNFYVRKNRNRYDAQLE